MTKLGLGNLIKNSLTTLVRQLGVGLLQLATVVAIARTLGPEGNGQFAIALLLPTMLSTFLNMGLPNANVHFIGSKKVSVAIVLQTSLIWSAFLIFCGLICGSIAIAIFGNKWFPGVSLSALWLALCIYPGLLIQTFLVSIFQGLQDFKSYNLVLLSQPTLTLFLILLLGTSRLNSVTVIVGAYLAGSIAALIAAGIMIPRGLEVIKSRCNSWRDYSISVTGYALKTHLSIALAFLNYRVDFYLLNFFGNTTETGLYAISTQIAEKLWLLSAAVGIVLLPHLSELSAEKDRMKKVTPLVYIWVLLLTSVAGLFTVLLASPLITLLFGEIYRSSAVIVQFLVPGVIAWSGARVLAYDIAARGRPELNIYMNLGTLLINIIGNILLIPQHGTRGAAIATTVAYCLFSIQMVVVYTKLFKINWKTAFNDFKAINRQKISQFLS